jgi:hypothetical protein
MQVVTLSDHTGDKVRQARQSREAAYARECEAHTDKVRHFEAVRHDLRQRAGAAWNERRIGTFLLASVGVVMNALQRRPALPRMAAAGDQERIWEAGNDGEAQVLAMLATQLGSDWTALTGYKNHKGEGDLLLVGPPGVLGVEIKNMSGVVSCQGDTWSRDKYDNYGNCVERNLPIKDRGGRSPAQQINEVCIALGGFLLKRHQQPTILTAVVLTHPKGRAGQIASPTVNFVGRVESFNVPALFQRCGSSGQGHDSDTVVRLITQDHAHHARGPRQRAVS